MQDMQPNQPLGPSSPVPNPYDFITNPGQRPKRQLFGGGGSLTKRIILVVGGAVLLMIIIAIVVSFLTSGGSSNLNSLKSIVAQQQELARVAGIGADKAQDSTIRSYALTAKLSVTSQQQKLIAYLESKNVKLSKEELAAKQDKSVDEALDAATSSNRFDEAFNEELTGQLNNYATDLQEAFDSTSNQNGKTVLSDSYSSTAIILGPK
jgi:hypothetical protein